MDRNRHIYSSIVMQFSQQLIELHPYENKLGTAAITVTIKLHWPENYRGERHNFVTGKT